MWPTFPFSDFVDLIVFFFSCYVIDEWFVVSYTIPHTHTHTHLQYSVISIANKSYALTHLVCSPV